MAPPGNRPVLLFFHCLHQACRNASWLIAVHALFLDKNLSRFRFVAVDDSPLRYRGLPDLIEYRSVAYVREGKMVRFSASQLTAPTSHAPDGIDKDPHKFLAWGELTCRRFPR
jgi:hypothetical protein